jgi:hypothetical protein
MIGTGMIALFRTGCQMRNQLFILAVTLLTCTASFGEMRAATPDELARSEKLQKDVRVVRKDSHPTRTQHAARSKQLVSPTLKLPSHAPTYDSAAPLKTAPGTPVQDANSWSGFYAGGHGSGGWGRENSASPSGVRP